MTVHLHRNESGPHELGQLLCEVLGDGLSIGLRTWEGDRLGPPDPPATLVVNSREALSWVLRHPGQLGLARAFVAGDLDVEGDLVEALRQASQLDGVRPTAWQWAMLARLAGHNVLRPKPAPPEEVRLHGRRHTVRRDHQAVTHHYDLSNDFYQLVLGPSMTYSCAVFEDPSESLEAAQTAKHDLIASKLALGPQTRLLDVGCGWGSMIEHAVIRYGVSAVGVTLSVNQHDYAMKRLATAGGKTTIRVQDYRLVDDGPYDAISSIGMSEHVGQARLEEYFSKLFNLLRPGGRLLNHAISALPAGRTPARWLPPLNLQPRGSRPGFAPDSFFNRYIFPDGELIEMGTVASAMQRAGFEVRHVENLREHYGLTLRRWLANLDDHWTPAVNLLGPRRARAWRLYLAGSIFGFDTARIAIHQVLAVRPNRGRSEMPLRPDFS